MGLECGHFIELEDRKQFLISRYLTQFFLYIETSVKGKTSIFYQTIFIAQKTVL